MNFYYQYQTMMVHVLIIDTVDVYNDDHVHDGEAVEVEVEVEKEIEEDEGKKEERKE